MNCVAMFGPFALDTGQRHAWPALPDHGTTSAGALYEVLFLASRPPFFFEVVRHTDPVRDAPRQRNWRSDLPVRRLFA